MKKQQVGVIGLAVMGKNLALNIADHGFSVSVYNRSVEKTNELITEVQGKDLLGFPTLKDFIESLEVPRKIILMVKAGEAVDKTIELLVPLLSKGDLIMDGGNSHYPDTIRRSRRLEEVGINYLGTGISGGEEGARNGPAIMPGGKLEAYLMMEPILSAISAKVDSEPCSVYIGENGSGHFVKMVHNGIEYADMQLICEAYSIMKNVLELSPEELHNIFADWNKGELNSYLIEITTNIFSKKDSDSDGWLVDKILDVAGQKGTGKWTAQVSLDLGVPSSTITAAVFERYLSSIKEERIIASKIFSSPENKIEKSKEFIEAIRKALYASKICAYAQGFSLMKKASEDYGWKLNYADIAKIFRGGCIIRAQFLNQIALAYKENPSLTNLLVAPYFQKIIDQYQNSWRDVVIAAIQAGVSVPGFTSALSYYDSYRSERLPMNLLQAQRDYFGAHTYERTDKPGFFHTSW